jgi:hypothetical protein
MKGITIRARAIAMGAALLLTAGRGAMAQWGVNSYGVLEGDTKQTYMVLGGLSASPAGRGLKPLVGLQAYYLTFDAGSSRTNEFNFHPSVGVVNSVEHGAYYATIGYAFSSKDNNNVAIPVATGVRGKGVVLSAGADWSTPPGPMAYQALASYNFGSESFWGRGRATARVARSGTTTTRFGGEVALNSGTGYQSWEPGLVMTWMTDAGTSWGIGAGAKIIDNGGNAAYARIEFGFPVAR